MALRAYGFLAALSVCLAIFGILGWYYRDLWYASPVWHKYPLGMWIKRASLSLAAAGILQWIVLFPAARLCARLNPLFATGFRMGAITVTIVACVPGAYYICYDMFLR